jgi:4-hydroxy-4-methyl-2-oxoglutarate aldolase
MCGTAWREPGGPPADIPLPAGRDNGGVTDALTRLADLDTCAVSDALDKLGLQGVVTGLAPVTLPHRISGRVITVELGPAPGAAPQAPAPPGAAPQAPAPPGALPGRRHIATAAVEAAGAGDIIVIAAGGSTAAPGWGGLLSLAAVTRGVGGVIVDGACRDVDEARELGLPIYARACVPRTARGRLVETRWNHPVPVAGITVAPGDLVIADGSGVVFVPAPQADVVAAAASEIAAREAAMARRIRAGEPVSQVMSAAYEHMLLHGQDPATGTPP